MTRTDRATAVDPARAEGFAEVGRRLLSACRAIRDLGGPQHASALGILSVHAGIAYTDALCVRRAGRKSSSPDHRAVINLLRHALGDRLPTRMVRHLERLLGAKDGFEYEGVPATMEEAEPVFVAAERYAAWAEEELTREA